ncbi:MAG: YbbR-like domain-containing protein [bacterium]|jgi:hypothetical protein
MKISLGNLALRGFSLAAATVLWATFVASPPLVRSVSASIELRNVPAGLEISSEVPTNVYLEISGPSAQLHSMNFAGEAVVLDLGSVNRPGEHTFTIEPGNIELPPGMRVIRAIPSQIRLRFERRATAQLPVRVRLAAPPPEGFVIVREIVSPPTLAIAGPESHVRRATYAETDPIELVPGVGWQVHQVQSFVRDSYLQVESSPAVTVSIELARR